VPVPLLVKTPKALLVGQEYGTLLILMRSPEEFTRKGLPIPTLSKAAGIVVPIPTLPLVRILIFSVLFVTNLKGKK
jgi:hypothetical protein